jgi:hypothetical protein
VTLSQLAFVFFVCLLLGSVAITLDWSSTLVAADSAAVEAARVFMPPWEPLERAIVR